MQVMVLNCRGMIAKGLTTIAGRYKKLEGTVLHGFFVIKAIFLPLFYFFFYYAFIGLAINEVPIHSFDLLYETNSAPMLSMAKALFEIMATYTCIFVSISAPSFATTKIISYFMAVATVPAVSIFAYAVIITRGALGLSNEYPYSFYILGVISLGSVLLSLAPPFCRRRAHILHHVYAPIADIWKFACEVILNAWPIATLPIAASCLYVATMCCLGHFFDASAHDVVQELVVRWISVLFAIVLRAITVTKVFVAVFDTSLFLQKKDTMSTQLGMVFIILFLASFTEAIFSLGSFLQVCSYTYVLDILLMGQKIFLEWFLSSMVVYIWGGFDYAGVKEKRKWAYKNMHFFATAEIGKGLIFLIVLLVPLSLTYFFFGRNTMTTSSSSQVMSLSRTVLAFFYSVIDSSCKLLLIGRRLALPERYTRHRRLTYTEVSRSVPTR